MMMGWTRISSLGNTQQLTAGAVGSIVPRSHGRVREDAHGRRRRTEDPSQPAHGPSVFVSLPRRRILMS